MLFLVISAFCPATMTPHIHPEPDESSAQSNFAAACNNLLVHLASGELAPPTEPGFSQGFFSILSPMEFWFLAAVASGLLSWGHLITSDIADLIA